MNVDDVEGLNSELQNVSNYRVNYISQKWHRDVVAWIYLSRELRIRTCVLLWHLFVLFIILTSFLTLTLCNESSSELPNRVNIAGIITDGVVPIKDAIVEVEDENGVLFQNYTNENGEFSFNVQPGVYTIYVSKEGYVQGKMKNIEAYDNITNLSIELSISAIIRGRVTCEGLPVEGITVHAISEHFDTYDLTDSDGFYNISRDLPQGNVTLYIEEEGFVKYQESINVSAGMVYHIDISIQGYVNFSGQVFDRRRMPVEGASVTLYASGLYFNTTTNSSGMFTLSPNLGAGDYNITVKKDGFSKFFGIVRLPQTQILEITLDYFLELYSPANGTVTILERIEFLGRTERESRIILENGDLVNETTSDMNGNFSLEIELLEGENNISLTSTNGDYSENIKIHIYRIPHISVIITKPYENSTLNTSTLICGYVTGSKVHSVVQIEIWIDGEYMQTNESWNFEFLWKIDERDNGRHLISVCAKDYNTGYLSYANISVEVLINYHREVQVISPDGKSTKPGDVLTFAFKVVNLGEKIDSFRIITESRSGWLCDAEYTTLVLQAGEARNVSVLLAIPSNAQNGWKDEVTLVAVSGYDAEVENAGKVSAIVISENFSIGERTIPYLFAFVLIIAIAIFSFYLGKKSKEDEIKNERR